MDRFNSSKLHYFEGWAIGKNLGLLVRLSCHAQFQRHSAFLLSAVQVLHRLRIGVVISIPNRTWSASHPAEFWAALATTKPIGWRFGKTNWWNFSVRHHGSIADYWQLGNQVRHCKTTVAICCLPGSHALSWKNSDLSVSFGWMHGLLADLPAGLPQIKLNAVGFLDHR